MKWKFLYGLLVLFIIQQINAEENFENLNEFEEDDGIVEVDDDKQDITTEENNDEVEDFGDYSSPKFDNDGYYFGEHFDELNDFKKNWIKSLAKKDDIDDSIAKYDGIWELEPPKRPLWKNDLGLVLKSKAKHAAISSKLKKPFKFEDKPFIVQYEVQLQEGQECGGSYIKLLSQAKGTEDLTKFNDKTPYTIMFGPDKCGNDVKLHFIFRHVNPINGTITEKHCRKPKDRLEEPFKDKLPHLYRLVINPDNTYQVSVDHNLVNEGSLFTDFTPPVNPPREIDDPNDVKPDNWDEREKIPDPDAKKPDDWDEEAPPKIHDPHANKPENWLDDEPEMISDPNAQKPEDWDVSIDGDWEAPLIDNPACKDAPGCGPWSPPLINNPEFKGKWRAPMIENPNYQGKWAPRKIQNPDFFEDKNPFKMTPIVAVGIELWSMSNEILFDNIVITDDVDLALEYASKTFDVKKKYLDKAAQTFLNKFIDYSNENPWLWGLYILVVGTPFSFIVYSLCCTSSKEEEREQAAKAKKTDEISPDDDIPEDEQQAEEVDSASPRSKKSDLEVNNRNEEDEEEEEEIEEVEEEEEEENNEEPKIENIEETNKKLSPEGTRKRKPRKD